MNFHLLTMNVTLLRLYLLSVGDSEDCVLPLGWLGICIARE